MEPQWAYGSNGSGKVPKNSSIFIDLEILAFEVQKKVERIGGEGEERRSEARVNKKKKRGH